MARSIRKGPVIDHILYKRVMKMKNEKDPRPIKTYSRASTVIPEMVGLTISIYNGKLWKSVYVTEDLVGHKLGEFAPTRIFRKHADSKRK